MFSLKLVYTFIMVVHAQKNIWYGSDQPQPSIPNILTIPSTNKELSPREKQFRVVYEWQTIDFAYKSDYDRGFARKRGDFIEKNVIISDIKAFGSRLYITLPRLLRGVPATLGWTIAPDNNGRTDPLIEPFPSWDMNRYGDCRGLQFVQAIEIDSDGVLWAVDSGRPHSIVSDLSTICPPKLVLFDLKRNGSIIHRFQFPHEVVAYGTNFLNKIVVDDGFDGFAYITDNNQVDPGIVVYSKKHNRSWKIREKNTMRASPDAINFAVNGTYIRFSIHINGIALGPYLTTYTGNLDTDFDRFVYYSPLSSYHLYSIPASILRNPEYSDPTKEYQLLQFITDHGPKASQTDGMIMDNHGILYYGLLKKHAIVFWNCFQPFTEENQQILAMDDNYIHWVDGMSFDENSFLYVVVNRFYNFVSGRLKTNEVNFRILRAETNGISYVFTNKDILVQKNMILHRMLSKTNPFYLSRYNFIISLSTRISSNFIIMLITLAITEVFAFTRKIRFL